MMYLYLIVLVFGYLVVGSVIGALISEDITDAVGYSRDNFRVTCTLFYPLLIIAFIVLVFFNGINKLGDIIVDLLKNKLCVPIGKQLRIWFGKEDY